MRAPKRLSLRTRPTDGVVDIGIKTQVFFLDERGLALRDGALVVTQRGDATRRQALRDHLEAVVLALDDGGVAIAVRGTGTGMDKDYGVGAFAAGISSVP